MESTIDHVELLLSAELDEIHRVAGDANRQLRILLRVIHRVDQCLTIEYVNVDVVARFGEIPIEQPGQIRDAQSVGRCRVPWGRSRTCRKSRLGCACRAV